VHRDIPVSAFSSGLFLRSGEDEVLLSMRNFTDWLEEFDKLSLKEQRKEFEEALTKV